MGSASRWNLNVKHFFYCQLVQFSGKVKVEWKYIYLFLISFHRLFLHDANEILSFEIVKYLGTLTLLQ